MRQIAFLLAIHFAITSTQPMWQPLAQALFGDCGGSTCSVATASCAAHPTPPGNATSEDGKMPDGCCVPFQCCFPCCCYCPESTQLSSFVFFEKNTRPSEKTKTLLSTCIDEHFQPPEIAQQS